MYIASFILSHPTLSTALKQKMFGPYCDSVGVQVMLTYHCNGGPYGARSDLCTPGGDTVGISVML